jgi:Mitochondrial carrier protein
MGTSGRSSRQRKALADALSGVVASLVSLWTLYPMDVIKTNLQANLPVSSGMYRGVATKTLHTASSNFLYFYIYSWILSWTRRNKEKPSTITRLALSAIAAMLNTCLTLPLDVLSAKQQTRQQATTKMNQVWKGVEQSNFDTQTGAEDEKKDDTAPERIQSVVPDTNTETEPWTVLWKGLWPSLLLCTNPSIHYTAFDVIKTRILQRQSGKHTLTMVEAFFVGLLAKFVATMSTYPLIRTKIMLMVTSEKSMLQCLGVEYKQNGLKGLYRGCHVQLFHTLLKSALLMMVRERITDTTHRLLVPTDN